MFRPPVRAVMNSPPLKIAVAGLGFMGATHIRAWYSVAGASLAAVVSGNPAKLAGDLRDTGGNLAQQSQLFDFSQVKRYTSIPEALADPAIDAVDLCLPTHLHAPVGLAALRAGKHVLVEKPLALSSAEADTLVEESRVSGRTLMAGHILRFMPAYQQLAALARTSEIKLASFRRKCAAPSWSPWLTDTARSGGAPLDLLIHDADFALSLFGNPEWVSATGYSAPALGIDWLTARCSFRKTGPVDISGGWLHPNSYPFSMEFTAVTDEETLDYSSAGRPLTSFRKSGDAVPVSLPEGDPWADQLAYFTNCVRTGAAPDLCPPAQSAAAVRFAEIMKQSRERNGERISWNQ